MRGSSPRLAGLVAAALLLGILVGVVAGGRLLAQPSKVTVTVPGPASTVVKTVFLVNTSTVTVTAGQPLVNASRLWSSVGVYLSPTEALRLLQAPPAGPVPVAYTLDTAVATPLGATVTAATPRLVVQSASAPAGYGSTNVQVAGVDEPDIAENNGTHLFVARGGTVEAYRAWPPRELGLAAVFDAQRYVENTTGPMRLVLETKAGLEVLLNLTHRVRVVGLLGGEGGRLVVLAEDTLSPWLPGLQPRTWVIALGPDMRPLWSRALAGTLVDARLANGTLVVATTQWRLAPPIVFLGDGAVAGPVVLVGREPVTTTLAAFSLETGRYSMVAFAGARPRTIYMTPGGDVYLALPGVGGEERRVTVTAPLTGGTLVLPLPVSDWRETTLLRLHASPDAITPAASTTLPGAIDKQWQLDVYNGTVRVVTTAYTGEGTRVDLYILDAETLEKIGELKGIAVRERVHAVRFLGPYLYLVTFRNTDPLFAIDLHDPAKPRILGYLKAPGFDEYLHPVAENLLLGIGREDARLRITLYQLKDAAPKPVARIYLGPESGGYSWSPVLDPLRGHRAFTYSPGNGIALIPVTITAYQGGAPTQEAGAAVIKVDTEKPGLKLLGLLSHAGAQRATYIDGYAYTIAPSRLPRVKAWSLNTLKEVAQAPRVEKATVEEILAEPAKYRGKLVDVTGVYAGWAGTAEAPPPVTRSDWLLRGKTGAEIYVTGAAPPAPPTMAGKLIVRVIGTVEVKDGKPYIRAVSVETIASTR